MYVGKKSGERGKFDKDEKIENFSNAHQIRNALTTIKVGDGFSYCDACKRRRGEEELEREEKLEREILEGRRGAGWRERKVERTTPISRKRRL